MRWLAGMGERVNCGDEDGGEICAKCSSTPCGVHLIWKWNTLLSPILLLIGWNRCL